MEHNQQEPALGLVGRHFHVLGSERCVFLHGKVITQVDPTHYLVQFYPEGTLHVFDIGDICTASILRNREPGAWQFYDDEEQWLSWYESHAPAPPEAPEPPGPNVAAKT